MSIFNYFQFNLLVCFSCGSITAFNAHTDFGASPCQTSLGLQYGTPRSPLGFHIMTSTGDTDAVRLNSPAGWTPSDPLKQHYIKITTAAPVLITGILLQGGLKGEGRVTTGAIHLSLDCTSYISQNFSTSETLISDTVITVNLSTIAFARCIRIVPYTSMGQTPAMRLDLLGCAIANTPSGKPLPSKAPELLYHINTQSTINTKRDSNPSPTPVMPHSESKQPQSSIR